MTIRLARSGDLAPIRACAEDAYSPYVAVIGKKPAPMVADFGDQINSRLIHVGILDGDLVGFITFYPTMDLWHIENLAVFQNQQGTGVGSRLLRYAEDIAFEFGFNVVELYTNAAMTSNIAFDLARDYAIVDQRFDGGFERVFMRKTLTPR